MKSMIRTLLLAGGAAVAVSCAEAGSREVETVAANGAPADASSLALAGDAPAGQEDVQADHGVDHVAPAEEPAVTSESETAVTGGPRSIYAGVYNSAQAARGLEIQNTVCMMCHTTAEWGGGRLLATYAGQPILAFVEELRATMPLDSPGRLEFAQYVDVTARILQINGVPEGSSELPADDRELAEILMEYRR